MSCTYFELPNLMSSELVRDYANIVYTTVPPTLLGSEDVRTLSVPLNGHLTLECLADSDPSPDIEWYKDEVEMQVQDVNTFTKSE